MKRLPLWLRVVLGVAIVVVLVGLALPVFLNVDRYRPTIIEAVEKSTGRKMTLGKISARFVPRIGFTIEDVHLSNPPGFPAGDLLAVEAIRGNLAFWKLLSGNIELTGLELVRPKIELLEDARGKTNYSFEESAAEKKPARGGAAAKEAESTFRLSDIDRVKIREADLLMATLTPKGRDVALAVRKLNLELSNLQLVPLDLKRWKGESDLSGAQVVLGALKDPAEVRSGSLKLENGRLDLDLRGSLGKAVSDVRGKLSVADLARPEMDFDLSTPQLDADALLASLAGGSSSDPAPAPKGPSELVAQGKIAAARLSYAPYNANNATLVLRLFTDRMELWPLAMQLYGGTLQASTRVDRTQAPQRFSSNIQVRGVDVGKLLSVKPETKGKLTGAAELNLQVFGSLGNTLKQSLNGTGNFAIRDGKVPGFQLPGALDVLSRFTGGSQDLAYRAIEGDLNIARERITSNRIHLDSPTGTVDLRGSLGLDGSLDYDGQAVLTPTQAGAMGAVGIATGILGQVTKQNIAQASIPFALRGTLDSIKVLPGKGLPGFKTAAPAGQTATPQQQQKKSILDLFRKP